MKQKSNRNQTTTAAPKKLNKHQIITIACSAALIFAHVAILLFVAWSWKYYDIYPSLFGSAVGIILCLLAIIDIIFFVGFNQQDLALKIISTVLACLLLISGTVGSYFINRTNKIVNNLFDDGSEKYETFSGVFVCYDKYNNFTSIQDLAGKSVGVVQENTDGITYLATKMLDEAKIDYATVEFKTNTELMTALIDNKVDAIAINSAYRTIYGAKDEGSAEEPASEVEETEETEVSEEGEEEEVVLDQGDTSPFAVYMNHLIDFDPFEEQLKIESTKRTKNISNEPFNVLLIGYSRTDIGSPVGLADSIIVATINPQSYTVSMTSIARDSFVPISCYGGERDKINSGRSTSRECFIETVEDFIGMDIDYYMELDYLGLVQIVNAIGGVYINNPVAFTLDGIYVPAGHYLADGQMALQFSRERHHMPGGDFARQQHQKEVIIEIARKLVTSGDLSLALNAMDEASDWMSTDMPLSQLTTVFNLLLNTKNYTGLDTFSLVDFQNTRITGNGGIYYYSYPMRLPLWVYLIYQGSYDESMDHIKNVMGNWDEINQQRNFSFSLDNKYVRPELASTDYENEYIFTPDPMPAFWQTLIGLSESQARSWANSNGVSLSVKYIYKGESGFDGSLSGYVVDQSARYGSLVSEYPSGTITVMGPDEVNEDQMLPDFVGRSYSKAVDWAKEHGISYSVEWDEDSDESSGRIISQSPKAYTAIDEIDKLRIVVAGSEDDDNDSFKISFNKNGHGLDSDVPSTITVESGEDRSLKSMSDDGNYEFLGWYTTSDYTQGERIRNASQLSSDTTLYARWGKKEADAKTYSYRFLVDGSVIYENTGKEGDSPKVPSDPTKDGYTFTGWSPKVGKLTANIDYTATFEKKQEDKPEPKPEVTCWDGSKAESEDKCPVKPEPVTCWDGSTAESEDKCPVKPEPVTCWDGSVVDSADKCPVEESGGSEDGGDTPPEEGGGE